MGRVEIVQPRASWRGEIGTGEGQIMNLELERRSIGEVGATGRTVTGYPIIFDAPTNLGDFTELVEPSAVDRTLREGVDVRALLDHDDASTRVLGRRSAGTLRLVKDARGLRSEIDLPKTQAGDDILELVTRGDISGMSFAFAVQAGGQRWEQRAGRPLRILTDLLIPEVSIVTFPAYQATDVQVAKRSLEHYQRERGQSVAWLRMRHTAAGV